MSAVSVKARELTKVTLREELERLGCGSVLVCGRRAAIKARRILAHPEFDGLKVHVDPDRDPDSWELF